MCQQTFRCVSDRVNLQFTAPLAQQITFSTYKNKNTAKVLIGVTPGGMVSYISPAYGGSTRICNELW